MKIYINNALVFLVSITLFSCDLDEVNPSGATAEAIWSTPDGLATLVNAAYSDQRQLYGKIDGPFMYEMGTDLWFNKDLDGYGKELSKYENFTPGTGNPNKKGWSVPWKAINLCNAGINRIEDVDYTDIEQKQSHLAQLRFLRAFYYYHIVETYGGVMLRTEETLTPLLTATRSSVAEFYDLIISDLRYAQQYLPLDNGDQYSRASKKSAYGLLARVLLSRSYYEEYGDTQSYLQQTKDLADSIIDMQADLGVSLWDSFVELWDPENNANNKEALYIISNSENTAINFDPNANRLHRWFMMRYIDYPGLTQSIQYGETGDMRFAPTLTLLDYFDRDIDSRYDASFREVWLHNMTQPYVWTSAAATTYNKDASVVGQTINPGDTALYVTKESVPGKEFLPYVVYDRDDVYNTSGDGSLIDGRNFVQLTKFEDPLRATPDQIPGYLDIMVIRLAEIYLIAAEANFQLGNYDQAATNLNVLRTRAAVKTPVDRTADMQINASDVQDGGIEFILAERARELAGEHMRWFDVKRVYRNTPSQFVSFIKTKNPNITEVAEHNVLRPVPQEEMDALLNREEFGQNFGY